MGNVSLDFPEKRILAREANAQVDLAIIVTMMEWLSENEFLANAIRESPRYEEVRIRHSAREMFRTRLQFECYGSVREQILFFQEKMPHYLKRAEFEAMQSNFREIIDIRKDRKKRRFELFTAIAAILFAAAFALPSICDTLSVVRSCIPVSDIPIITIEAAGIVVWLALMVAIAFLARLLRPDAPEKIRKGMRFGKGVPIGIY